MFHIDDGRNAFAGVVAGKVLVFFLEQVVVSCILIYHTGNGRAQTRNMGTAVMRVNGVGEGMLRNGHAIGVLEGDFDFHVVNLFAGINGVVQNHTAAIEVLHKGAQPPLKVEVHVPFHRRPFIAQGEKDRTGDKRHLAEPVDQRLETHVHAFFGKNFLVKQESGVGSRLLAFFQLADFPHRLAGHAPVVFLEPQMAIPLYFDAQPFGEGVDGRRTHPMQPTRHLVG